MKAFLVIGPPTALGMSLVSSMPILLADYFLLLYGANDVLFNVPSGLGKSPGQPGYPRLVQRQHAADH